MENIKGCAELHVKVRIENGQLVEKEIVCPNCGGLGGKFIELDGVSCALLACTECGEHLAEFPTNAEMEKRLEETWQTVQSYLVRLHAEEN